MRAPGSPFASRRRNSSRAQARKPARPQRSGAQPPRRPPSDIKADINVTPLVDVVLVLLIIFMVVTPIIASGIPVELPKTANHDRKPDDGKDIIISVTADKRVYVASRPVPDPKDVTRIVAEERRKHPEKAAFVKGDSRATYGVVREVMEAVHRAGIDDVMLGTKSVEEQE